MRGTVEGFSRFYAGGKEVCLRGLVRNGFDAAERLCAKMDAPETVICSESRKVKTALVDGFFVKRYNMPGKWNQFRRIFRTGRPLRSLVCAEKFALAGVETPKVLAALTEKSAAGYRDILITEALAPDCRTANLLFPIAGKVDGGWGTFANAVIPLLAILHDHGIAHGDLNIRNIYCSEDLSRWGMIDLDGGVCRHAPLPLAMRERELARLASSFVRSFPASNMGSLAADSAARYARLTFLKPDVNRIWKRMEYLLNF